MLVSRCTEQARGRVLDQSSQALLDKLQRDLLPHLVAARALLPVLASRAATDYIVIGGPGSENPWAGYGHRSICRRGATMLLRVLHDEARALSVRVQMLSVDSPVRTADNASCACEQWPSAIALGMQALALLDQTDATKSVQAVVKVTGAVTAPRPVARIAHAADAGPRAVAGTAGRTSCRTTSRRWWTTGPARIRSTRSTTSGPCSGRS